MTNVTDSSGKDHTIKGHQKQVCVALPPELVEGLKRLSQATRVPIAAYFTEAIEDLLGKKNYASVLRRAKSDNRGMKALFKVLSNALVVVGLGSLLSGADMPGLVLCGLGLAGIGIVAYSR